MVQTKVAEKIKTHFVLSNFSFFENRAVYEKILLKKYCRTAETTDDNTAHAHCMLDIKG